MPTGPTTNPPAARTPRWLMPAVALWGGLLAGLVEVVVRMAERRLGWRWFLRLDEDHVWMIPVTDAALFLVPAAALCLLGRLFPRANLLPVAVFAAVFLLAVKVLLLIKGLHELAVLMLAVGLAVQVTRWVGWRVAGWRGALLRTLAVMVVAVLTLAATSAGARELAEREALASLPPAPRGAPNVILITLDTVRAENLSLHGYHRRTTPNLERWAKKGAWFRRALAPAPWTLPTHASLFTGRYPHELSATWNTPLDRTHPTLAEALRDGGYLTGGFVANMAYVSHESGLDRGFVRFEDFPHDAGEFLRSSALSHWLIHKMPVRQAFDAYNPYYHKTAAEVNDCFLRWLDTQEERPFFAFLNYMDAHDPYLPPPPFDRLFGPPPTDEEKARLSMCWVDLPCNHPRTTVEAAVRGYDGAIAYMDAQLDRLLGELERRGRLGDTVVIVTADHGEHFGEHGSFLHGQTLYRQLLHVPLVVIAPGRVPSGTVVEDFVTLRDVAATVLDLTDMDVRAKLPGHSLARHWSGSAVRHAEGESPLFQVAFPIPHGYAFPDQCRSPVASGPLGSLVLGRRYYIKNLETGKEEVYDFDADPRDERNLAEAPEHRPLLEAFRREMDRVLREHRSRWVDFP